MHRAQLPVLILCLVALAPALAWAEGREVWPPERMIIGAEYAFPGMAEALAKTGIAGVKHFPEAVTWGKMQPKANGPLDFTELDRFVRDYQTAGFRHCLIALRSQSAWASKNFLLNPTPKPVHEQAYALWITAVVERYDGDGITDMPGLRWPVNQIEIGVEFSTYEPEPVADYLKQLKIAYNAAHKASGEVVVLHAAFLFTGAFAESSTPPQAVERIRQLPRRIAHHPYESVGKILDHPELFDALNLHSLGQPEEIERMVAWLRWETGKRNYTKPLVISDTAPNPLIAWGPANTCEGKEAALGVLLPPATEADRCNLAAYFQNLIDGDPQAVAWNHRLCAEDLAKKLMYAAASDVSWINTAFIEDLKWQMLPVFNAGAGTTAWAGMLETRSKLGSEQRTVIGYRPGFYALRQMQRLLAHSTEVSRIALPDATIQLFHISRPAGDAWVMWHEPGKVVLPWEDEATKSFRFAMPSGAWRRSSLVVAAGEESTRAVAGKSDGSPMSLTLSTTPLLLESMH